MRFIYAFFFFSNTSSVTCKRNATEKQISGLEVVLNTNFAMRDLK